MADVPAVRGHLADAALARAEIVPEGLLVVRAREAAADADHGDHAVAGGGGRRGGLRAGLWRGGWAAAEVGAQFVDRRKFEEGGRLEGDAEGGLDALHEISEQHGVDAHLAEGFVGIEEFGLDLEFL
jgi:hypothetical protein